MGRKLNRYFFQRGNADGQEAITTYQRNANQNHNEISPYTCQNGYHEKNSNNECWQGCGEKGTLEYFSGNVNWYCHCGKQYGSFSKN